MEENNFSNIGDIIKCQSFFHNNEDTVNNDTVQSTMTQMTRSPTTRSQRTMTQMTSSPMTTPWLGQHFFSENNQADISIETLQNDKFLDWSKLKVCEGNKKDMTK